MRKRLLILLLMLTLVLNLEMVVDADVISGSDTVKEVIYFSEISNTNIGYAYQYNSNVKSIMILTDNATKNISAAISYATGIAYSFKFLSGTDFGYSPKSVEFYNEIIAYMESNLDRGRFLSVQFVSEEETVIKPQDAVASDLMPQLVARVGSEYSDKYITSYSNSGGASYFNSTSSQAADAYLYYQSYYN